MTDTELRKIRTKWDTWCRRCGVAIDAGHIIWWRRGLTLCVPCHDSTIQPKPAPYQWPNRAVAREHRRLVNDGARRGQLTQKRNAKERRRIVLLAAAKFPEFTVTQVEQELWQMRSEFFGHPRKTFLSPYQWPNRADAIIREFKNEGLCEVARPFSHDHRFPTLYRWVDEQEEMNATPEPKDDWQEQYEQACQAHRNE